MVTGTLCGVRLNASSPGWLTPSLGQVLRVTKRRRNNGATMIRVPPEPTSSLDSEMHDANEEGVDDCPRARRRIVWSETLDHALLNLSERARAVAWRNYLSMLSRLWNEKFPDLATSETVLCTRLSRIRRAEIEDSACDGGECSEMEIDDTEEDNTIQEVPTQIREALTKLGWTVSSWTW